MTSHPQIGPRILGLVCGDPATVLSGVARHLFDALDRRFPVVDRVDYGVRRLSRCVLAARTYHPRRADWRAAFYSSLIAHRALERTLMARAESIECEFDLALQVHGWVTGQPRPYALFLDQTRLMADRGWPGWIALPSTDRIDLLALERRMYAEAAHIFVMGGPARDSLLGDYEISAERVTIVGGGPILDAMPVEEPLAQTPTVLFIGRDFERKGGPQLLEAFCGVRAEIPGATLHLVGVEHRIEAPGVVVHGKITDRARLAEMYRSARVFCLPSRYEPYGLVLLEAMSHGVPCVGTRVQAVPEILGHGSRGRLVEPGEVRQLTAALTSLLLDRQAAQKLGLAGRRAIETELNWDRVATRMAPAILRGAR